MIQSDVVHDICLTKPVKVIRFLIIQSDVKGLHRMKKRMIFLLRIEQGYIYRFNEKVGEDF